LSDIGQGIYGVPTISAASHFSNSGTTIPTMGDDSTASSA
jgi:hypothetical protein